MQDIWPFYFTFSPLLSLCSIKEPSIQKLTRRLFWDMNLPSSPSASFLNKGILLASILVSDSLVCHVVSRVSLDSVTKGYWNYVREFSSSPRWGLIPLPLNMGWTYWHSSKQNVTAGMVQGHVSKGILASPSALVAITKTAEWVVQTTNIYFSQFWKLASPRSRCLQIRCLMRACFLACRSCFLLVSSCGRDSRGSGCFLISERHQLHQIGAPLSWPHLPLIIFHGLHLQIHQELGFQCMKLGRGDKNRQFITDTLASLSQVTHPGVTACSHSLWQGWQGEELTIYQWQAPTWQSWKLATLAFQIL